MPREALRRLSDSARRIREGLTWGRSPPLLAAILFLAVWIAIPTRLFNDDYSLVVTDRDGRLLGALLSRDDSWRFPPLGEVPGKIEKAFISFEDKRFYAHAGVDPLALARAAFLDVTRHEVVSGGSTITMQVARLGLGNATRGVLQKAAEMLVAVKLEALHSKPEVLRMFLSHAPFGGNVVGMEAASWRYFNRSPQDLSWAEAATLAVLPNAPSLIRLEKNRGLLLEKRNRLLRKLGADGDIDADTLALALEEKLPEAPYPIPMIAPHLVYSVQEGDFDAPRNGLVRTTVRRDLQERATEVVRQHLKTLAANDVRNACVLVLDNATASVLAYVGNSPDGESVDGGRVDVIRQPRSTGSILKPFLYAGMLNDGLLLPTELVPDIPTRFPGFAPENNSRTYRGAVPAYMALARSLNIPAIRLLRDYSLDRFIMDLKSLGMTTLFRNAADYGLPLIIGGAEGTLWEIAGMYSGLARAALGAKSPFFAPSLLPGRTNERHGIAFYSQGAAWLTLDALVQVQRPGDAENWEEFDSSKRIAWKTGTSQGFRDAWAIGVTRDYTVGVWVGNADGEPRPELGGTAAAAPLLFSVFGLLPDSRWFDTPLAALKDVEVCEKSGLPPGPSCAHTTFVKAPVNAPSPAPCPYCVTVHLDPRRLLRTNAVVENGGPMRNVSWFVLPPAMEWFYRQGNADYEVLPPYKHGAEPQEDLLPMNVLYPHEGSEVYIPRELDGSLGRVVVEAVHRDRHIRIFWHLDADYIGVTEELHSLSIAPAPGEHVLTLVDANGEMLERRFTVLDSR